MTIAGGPTRDKSIQSERPERHTNRSKVDLAPYNKRLCRWQVHDFQRSARVLSVLSFKRERRCRFLVSVASTSWSVKYTRLGREEMAARIHISSLRDWQQEGDYLDKYESIWDKNINSCSSTRYSLYIINLKSHSESLDYLRACRVILSWSSRYGRRSAHIECSNAPSWVFWDLCSMNRWS